jgi:lincosamide nucleotidyltransferase A/C/D/E
VPVAVAALQRRGYAPVPRPDTRAWNFILGDDAGHQVDFHVIVLGQDGRGIYGPPENGESYAAEAIPGVPVARLALHDGTSGAVVDSEPTRPG